MKAVFLALLFFFSLVVLSPEIGFAQTPPGLVSCGNVGQPDCDICGFVTTVDNVIDFLFKLLVLCAVLVLMYAGFKMVISQGDVGAWTKAKEMLANVVIGIVIVMAAWLIVDTVMKALLTDEFKAGGKFGPWNDLGGDCDMSLSDAMSGDESDTAGKIYCLDERVNGRWEAAGGLPLERCKVEAQKMRDQGRTPSECYLPTVDSSGRSSCRI